ncbi:MAG TPA: hypothetical protein VE057_17410 [Archangium sp.]|nr:hypothetical protein [Archangium sp.]
MPIRPPPDDGALYALTASVGADVPPAFLEGQAVQVLRDAGALPALLASTERTHVTFVGQWSELSVDVSQRLAEWALEAEGRGTAVLPVEAFAAPMQGGARERHDVDVIGAFWDSAAWELHPSGNVRVSAPGLVARLTGAAPPRALVVCGHGAEHCAALGEAWLAADPGACLAGESIPPEAIGAHLVVLNTCSSARLGDSVVPRQYHLASRMLAAGASIIGAFRNLSGPTDQFLEVLSALIWQGTTLGSLTTRLNAVLRESGMQPPSFIALGRAESAISAASAARAPMKPPSRGPGTGGGPRATAPCPTDLLVALSREVRWLSGLHHTVQRWELAIPSAAAIAPALKDLEGALARAADPRVASALAERERDGLLEVAARTTHRYREALLTDFGGSIQQGRWMQTLHCASSDSTWHEAGACPVCAGRRVRYVFTPRTSGQVNAYLDECDRCGTLADWCGAEEPPETFPSARVERSALEVHCATGPDVQAGRILIHRARSVEPRPLLTPGGSARFTWDELPFRGRLTVVAASFTRTRLAFSYRTLFVPGESLAGTNAVHQPQSHTRAARPPREAFHR